MPSHRGTRARGHRSEQTGDFGRARSGRGGSGRRKGLIRFWPAMALLAVSLISAWMVGEVKFSGSQGLVFADNGTQGTGSQDDISAEEGDQIEEELPPPDPGSPEDDAVNAGPQPDAGKKRTAPPVSPKPGNQPGAPSKAGPVSDLDRQFLSTVSLAAQWQIPTGADASKRASNALVKDAAQRIAFDQFNLNTKLKSVAAELAVQLPAQPTPEQQGWMEEISNASGKTYDQLFVDRTRAAQGKLFPLVGQTRGTTQNRLVRAFAQTTSTVTQRNMTFLERTGLVGPGSLPGAGNQGNGNTAPPAPPANPPAGGNADTGNSDPNQGDLEQGEELLPGDVIDEGGDASGGGNGTPGAPNNSTPPNPGANTPSDPLDLPQGNPAENQAGSVATTPTSSILGTGQDGTGKYIIITMLVIAGLIFLTALRGFYRRPR